jgi:cell division protease FtsH
MTIEEMENKMAVLLGGRAAEMLVFGHPSSGAADDLAKTTDIARAIVMRYGMHQELGLVAYEEERRNFLAGTPLPPGERRYSEATAREIDIAVRETISRAFGAATAILGRGRKVLEGGAKLLLEKETLVERDLQALQSDLQAELAAPRTTSLARETDG